MRKIMEFSDAKLPNMRKNINKFIEEGNYNLIDIKYQPTQNQYSVMHHAIILYEVRELLEQQEPSLGKPNDEDVNP